MAIAMRSRPSLFGQMRNSTTAATTMDSERLERCVSSSLSMWCQAPLLLANLSSVRMLSVTNSSPNKAA